MEIVFFNGGLAQPLKFTHSGVRTKQFLRTRRKYSSIH